MVMMIPSVLIIISTTADYYANPQDGNADVFKNRSSQL